MLEQDFNFSRTGCGSAPPASGIDDTMCTASATSVTEGTSHAKRPPMMTVPPEATHTRPGIASRPKSTRSQSAVASSATATSEMAVTRTSRLSEECTRTTTSEALKRHTRPKRSPTSPPRPQTSPACRHGIVAAEAPPGIAAKTSSMVPFWMPLSHDDTDSSIIATAGISIH
ncbi:unknown [Prevotella sp. CAG:873]|nr:unknown [Prevotella sp. CAG:873]